MLDIVKALVTLRLAITAVGTGAALALAGVWSLGHGAVGAGLALVAGAVLCVALPAIAARSRRHERTREH